jgi:hypothetical protein
MNEMKRFCPGNFYPSVILINGDRFQIFRFVHLPALLTSDVINSIPAGNNLGSIVTAGAFHRSNIYILKISKGLSRPFSVALVPIG